MTHFLADYALFLAKIVSVLGAVSLAVGLLFLALRKDKFSEPDKFAIQKLNDRYTDFAKALHAEILPKSHYKKWLKAEKIKTKALAQQTRKRIFVIDFHGDIKASAVNNLREAVTAILQTAQPGIDEVVVCLESAGGMVAPYGLAASQLQRLKQKKISLVVAIDKIAASGGYLMACVADRINAAPFAILGSIGVVAQLPNFHRFLKKHDIDFEMLTAGKYKRTLTVFGENTRKDRDKMQQELEEVHCLFKDFITQHRPQVDIQQVATGEHWLASKAIDLKLVDELITSDDYLLTASQQADIYQLNFHHKKTLAEKLSSAFCQRVGSHLLGIS